MHDVIVEGLELHLAGTGAKDPALREFTQHLDQCEACRLQVRELRDLSGMFAALRAPAPWEPAAGFYGRLAGTINRQAETSFWRLFSLDPVFRRVAFASVMFLAILGSFLVTQESNYASYPPNPETVMALQQGSQAEEVPPADDREMMLVTLTSYQP